MVEHSAMPLARAACRVLVASFVAAIVTGCVPPPRELPRRPPPPAIPSTTTTGPLTKVEVIDVRIPRAGELPQVVGRLQRHRVVAGENLLTIARDGGLGFRELRDANPTIDEWEPHAGVELVVPSRWILPRATYRGLVINIPEMRLYQFPLDTEPGERVSVRTWPVGLGAEEAPSPVGRFLVKSKDVDPTWIVPDSIRRTMEHPQRVVPPGPDNPLGEYRIRLDVDLYAIHGTNDPWTVGRLTTHGCIRLYPEDIAVLFSLVERGTPGELVYQPVKLGEAGGRIYAEVHQDVYQIVRDLERQALDEVSRAGLGARVDRERLRAAVRAKTGIPVDVTRDATSGTDPLGSERLAQPSAEDQPVVAPARD